MLPSLLVLPDRYRPALYCVVSGTDRQGRPVEHYTLQPAGAWTADYATDAHAVAYMLPYSQQPRLSKSAVADLPTPPVLAWAIVDVDNPDHAPWPDIETAWTEISATLAGHPLCAQGRAGWYLTRHGYRIVWPLQQPVPVTQAEPLLLRLAGILRADGIAADPACCDWTRLFRLPQTPQTRGVPMFFPWL